MAWHAARFRQRAISAVVPNQANKRILVPKRPPVSLPVRVMDFDGATSARLPQPWRPYSKNYDIQVRSLLKGAYGDFGRIIDSGNNARHLVATASSIQWRYPVQPSPTLDFLAFQTHTQNQVYDTALNGNNANGLPILNTSGAGTGDSQGSAPSDWADGLGIDTVGSNVGQAASFFEGYIARLYAIDRSPIQGRPYMVGNQNRRVNLANRIGPLGRFRVRWSGVQTGEGSFVRVCGGDDVAGSRFICSGTTAGTPSVVTFAGSLATRTVAGALADVAAGEQFSVELIQTSPTQNNSVTCIVNGVTISNTLNSCGFVEINQLYAGNDSGFTRNGQYWANIFIEDLDTGDTWEWKLDEGTGSAAINTGNTAGGATDYDGVWTDALGWLDDKPENSFYWPMNEGEGTSFLAYTYPGNIRAPAWDMPITGTGDWEEPVANGARVNI